MVFFTCNGCGESLKKNKVEQHSYKCRSSQYFTCIDCSKDFWGKDYATHISCLTENEKYGGSGYVSKESKGQVKRQALLAQIQELVSTTSMDPQMKKVFDHLLQFDNIPQKRDKFRNFMRNLKYLNNVIEEAWELIEQAAKKNAIPASKDTKNSDHIPGEENSNDTKSNKKSGNFKDKNSGPSAEVLITDNQDDLQRKSKRERKEERQKKQTKIQKKDKRKRDIDEDNESNESPKKKLKKYEITNQENEEPGNVDEEVEEESIQTKRKHSPFKWKKAIGIVLKDAPVEGMKMNKVKRKVLSLYLESQEDSLNKKSELEVDALIQKKLKMRTDKYLVVKDRVRLRK